MLNSDTLIFLQDLLPFKRYIKKHFIFYQSDTTVQGFFVTKTLLLHVENAVKWALVKIHNFCFLLEKAEIYTVNCTHRRKKTITVQQISTKKT